MTSQTETHIASSSDVGTKLFEPTLNINEFPVNNFFRKGISW